MTQFQKLASAILRAQEIHHNSYVNEDGWGTHTVRLPEAVEKAAREFGIPEASLLINCLCHYAWNDCQDWAEEILNKK